MHRTATRTLSALMFGGVLLVGCGGDDGSNEDAVDTSTTALSTTTTTTAPAVTGGGEDTPLLAIAASLSEWITAWNEGNARSAALNQAPGITIDESMFRWRDYTVNGLEAFAGRISPSVTMGGVREKSTGMITELFVGFDPDGDTTAAAGVATFEGLGDVNNQLPLIDAYRDMVQAPAETVRYVESRGFGFLFVTEGGKSVEAGKVQLFVTSADGEENATIFSESLQLYVLDLLGIVPILG